MLSVQCHDPDDHDHHESGYDYRERDLIRNQFHSFPFLEEDQEEWARAVALFLSPRSGVLATSANVRRSGERVFPSGNLRRPPPDLVVPRGLEPRSRR